MESLALRSPVRSFEYILVCFFTSYLIDSTFTNTQPEGGVKQGERFMASVISDDSCSNERSHGHNIPIGAWRDGICDCCIHGCCHPMCCLAAFARPAALGQVMTRMSLDWTGSPVARVAGWWSAFKVLLISFIVYIVVSQFLSMLVMPYQTNSDGQQVSYSDLPTWVLVVCAFQHSLAIAYAIFLLVVSTRTRAYIRQKYEIPEQHCSGCEDCCCSFWCGCCVASQMARHTADYRTYNAACCTDTGLPETAPHVV
jgi:Cys-rich protein (TIGR01571 family)